MCPTNLQEQPNISYLSDEDRSPKVDKDKTRKSNHRLTDLREELLNLIDFVWSSQDAVWKEKFNELVEYKAMHRHTNVPQKAGKLGRWVNKHRTNLGKKVGGLRTPIVRK